MTRYRVCGPLRVLGHEPGSRFDADLDSAHEARLIAAGHLEVVRTRTPRETVNNDAAAEADDPAAAEAAADKKE